MQQEIPSAHTAIVGGGPGGFAMLRALARSGRLADGACCLIDPDPVGSLGSGALGSYDLRSDTAGQTFVECAELDPSSLGEDRAGGRELLRKCSGPEPVALADAARLLRLGAAALVRQVASAGQALRIVRGTVLKMIEHRREWHLIVAQAGGQVTTIRARNVVLATGARPWVPRSVRSLAHAALPIVHSDQILRGLHHRLIAGLPAKPRIVILGGSHSALAAANVLLSSQRSEDWPAGSLRLVHRHPIKVMYPDAEAASHHRATFSQADICPATGRVYRFAGLRGDSAALWHRAQMGAEPRLCAETTGDGPATRLVEAADLIVSATGFSSRFADLVAPQERWDPDGDTRPVLSSRLGWRRNGDEQPGLFGIGLGASSPPTGNDKGEPSFAGEVNGVWYYQRIIAEGIVGGLRD